MSHRVDPATLDQLLPADPVGPIREAAYNLLAAREYDAVIALHGALQDIASAHFERVTNADTNEMRTYYRSKRRDALDMAYIVEEPALLAAQCKQERDNPGTT
jgi:hypothetical protein